MLTVVTVIQYNIHCMIEYDHEKYLTSLYCEMLTLCDFIIAHTTALLLLRTANSSGV